MFTFLFFIVGGMIGWMVKDYLFTRAYNYPDLHPEMFDENGNILPDQILAVRFENDYDTDTDTDEDEDD